MSFRENDFISYVLNLSASSNGIDLIAPEKYNLTNGKKGKLKTLKVKLFSERTN